jgi:hypothetical protein
MAERKAYIEKWCQEYDWMHGCCQIVDASGRIIVEKVSRNVGEHIVKLHNKSIAAERAAGGREE